VIARRPRVRRRIFGQPFGSRAILSAVVLTLVVHSAASAQEPSSALQYGGFVDLADLNSFNDPANHLFRNRGTTPRVDEWDVNMAAAWLKKPALPSSRVGIELTVQGGEDSKIFGFSSTAPKLRGADALLHLGPTDASYLAPIGKGLTIQGGIFSSLIGYDSLYAKDNFSATRPWGADYTPYLMLGVNASYPVSDQLTVTGAVVNGYWHLAHANDAPSLVGQAAYKATERLSLKETVLYGSHQPSTALEFWRVLSDTIVERKSDRGTAAFEYQLGWEKVDAPGTPRALWMSAQLPIRWTVRGPWSVTVRPEVAWDRDGRWIAGELGAEQSVTAITTTVEYRFAYKGALAIVRAEHRYDHGSGLAAGFFTDGETRPGVVGLTPSQHLLILSAILAFDSSNR
jgi:putative OmpL-like beta-barrel porin-2